MPEPDRIDLAVLVTDEPSDVGVMSRWIRYCLAAGIAACWVASLALPVVYLEKDPGGPMLGFGVLLFGWLGYAIFQFGWLANPLLLIVVPVFAFARGPHRRILGLGGILLLLFALNSLFWDDWPDDRGSNRIAAFGPAFYLWMIAVVGAGISALIRTATERKSQ